MYLACSETKSHMCNVVPGGFNDRQPMKSREAKNKYPHATHAILYDEVAIPFLSSIVPPTLPSLAGQQEPSRVIHLQRNLCHPSVAILLICGLDRIFPLYRIAQRVVSNLFAELKRSRN
jgi:hypothetical protein